MSWWAIHYFVDDKVKFVISKNSSIQVTTTQGKFSFIQDFIKKLTIYMAVHDLRKIELDNFEQSIPVMNGVFVCI